MHISEFQVGNYKCFYESPRLVFAPGFNVITGQNNVGKTALLEALSLSIGGAPHRSLKTVPAPDMRPDPVSWISFSVTLTRDELFDLLLVGSRQYLIVQPQADDPTWRRVGQNPQQFVEAVLDSPEFTFALRHDSQEGQINALMPERVPSFGGYSAQPNPNQQRPFFVVEIKSDRSLKYRGAVTGQDANEIGVALGSLLRQHVYRFSAERFSLGECAVGPGSVLAPNASNLPAVLNTLQANTAKFNEFNSLVSEIMPQVRQVSVIPRPNNRVEVMIWTIDPRSKRIDLARSLAQSGTGVGQVLAMLYVALTAIRPQVMIVDEPQSFLHPGAIRKLIEILRIHSQHQFIIATHSPSAITSANPATIYVLRSDAGVSEIDRIDVNQTKAQATYLNEIGARLSDVFGADNILWVEGATEELCFPLILNKVAGRSQMGTAILGIRQVGDLEGRDAERIFDIYSRLSRGTSLLPPAIGFYFDAECRTVAAREDIRRRSRNRVDFLPRRMFENFLLDPEAIVAVVNRIDNFRPVSVDPGEVWAIIETRSTDRKYLCAPEQGQEAGHWLATIDGARVLKDIFATLSETRVEFRKAEHSVALAEWIVENRPEQFREIANKLVQLLEAKPG